MFHSKFTTKENVNFLKIEDVKRKIKAGIPDAEIQVVDTQGTGDHFSAVVISNQFAGLSLVQQHRKVYKTVSDVLTRELHALQLKTCTFPEYKIKNKEK